MFVIDIWVLFCHVHCNCQIQQKEAGSREGVELSWDKLEVEAPRDLAGEVRYCVQAFVDDKSDAKEIYK